VGSFKPTGLIVAAADHAAFEHHERAHRHLARGQGGPSFIQRLAHEVVVVLLALGLVHRALRIVE
jgi:hypothetical protein